MSHVLESDQAEETNNKRDEQVEQVTDFIVEPAAHLAQLLNDLEEMEITFESDDDEMSEYNELQQENDTLEEDAMIRRSNMTSMKPSWLDQEIQQDINETKLVGGL